VSGTPRQLVILGRVSGLFGVKGWVKIHSYTDPRDGIADFERWILRAGNDEQTVELQEGRNHGRTVIAKLRGVDDRDQAIELVGAEIGVERAALAPCDPGEYYWTDLEGMDVVTTEGQTLGRLDHLFETGGHDVMVVAGDRQRLIPFVRDKVVQEVKLEQRVIIVDWDPTY
jgi:16S rRNA processing protein RimM